jgi:hypothetical protein
VVAQMTSSQHKQLADKDAFNSASGPIIPIIGRHLFHTADDSVGLGPPAAECGDGVFLVMGCGTPLVLRQRQGEWILVGDCYLHGVMKGEKWNEDKCDDIWLH